MRLQAIIVTVLLSAVIGAAQSAHRAIASVGCPGGKVSADLELASIPRSLDKLILMTDLIVRGTVVKTLPAFSRNPDIATAIETDSIVSVTTAFHGTAPVDGLVIVAQEGGKTDACEEVIPADPLLKTGDEYLFFLTPDDQVKPENTSGSPRYFVVGVWSGKIKIEAGKVRFLAGAHAGLRKHDGGGVSEFITNLRERIDLVLPKAAQ